MYPKIWTECVFVFFLGGGSLVGATLHFIWSNPNKRSLQVTWKRCQLTSENFFFEKHTRILLTQRRKLYWAVFGRYHGRAWSLHIRASYRVLALLVRVVSVSDFCQLFELVLSCPTSALRTVKIVHGLTHEKRVFTNQLPKRRRSTTARHSGVSDHISSSLQQDAKVFSYIYKQILLYCAVLWMFALGFVYLVRKHKSNRGLGRAKICSGVHRHERAQVS